MIRADDFERALARLIEAAGERERVDIPETQAISYIEEITGDHDRAIEHWEELSEKLRRWTVRNGRAVQWNFVRNAVQIRALPTAEELQNAAMLYEQETPVLLEQRIRSLSGIEFEHFLGVVLGRLPQFRNISLTRPSRDDGIDFKGIYVAEHASPHFALVGQAIVIGQAKQTSAAVNASDARDFIGALDTAGERRTVGLLISTSGFTEPALQALKRSRYFIITWGMSELLAVSQSSITRRIDVAFTLPDETFWDELLGRTNTS